MVILLQIVVLLLVHLFHKMLNLQILPMKKLLLCLLTLLLMVSCELETSSNGDLDGLWHLCSIETADSVQDISDKTIFWAVQVNLLSVRGADTEYLLRFHLTDDSLIVRDPYVSDRFHQMGNDFLRLPHTTFRIS